MKNTIVLLAIVLFFSCSSENNKDLQALANETVDNELVHGIAFSVLKNDTLSTYSSGNMTDTTQYFIASITKMYTTAVLLKLRSEGKLNLDDKIANYLPKEIMNGLHVYKGKDYSNELTIRHLMTQTSGLADYYEGKPEKGESLLDELLSGKDKYVSFEGAIAKAKQSKPEFAPSTEDAFYSDTNWQLLGKIAEKAANQSLVDLFQHYIFTPLDLKQTYVFADINDKKPIPMYYKENTLSIPKAMTGFQADGAIVSTSQENIVFLKAFYTGKLFPEAYLAEMQNWNSITFPLEYGMGMMRFKMSAFLSGGTAINIMGHAGSSGAFAFYDKEKDTYIAGTVNQMHKRNTSFKLMAKILSGM